MTDLSGSTRLAARMEAEDFAALLGNLHDIYHRMIARHGGTIAQISGDGVLALFGYPKTLEDDGRRAVEAALDLHEAVRGLPLPTPLAGERLRLHSGIHSGLVLLHEGDAVRGRFELHGNATNIASRFCDIAEADEILASEAALGPERHFFATGERMDIRVRGKDRPIAAFRIEGRADIGTRFAALARRGLTPFTGRHGPLAELESALADAMAGQGRLVAIEAPPGVGKTRLADELLDRAAAQGCRVVRGDCQSYLGAEPLQPFLQMLRAIFAVDGSATNLRAADAVAALLSSLGIDLARHGRTLLHLLSLGRGATGGELIGDAATALRDLFDQLAARAPLVLFVDDWQWADIASRQVLDAVRGLQQRPILILLTTRDAADSDGDIRDSQILRLAPLSDAETAEAIDRLIPAIDPFVREKIGAYSGGNPLFIEELCHSAMVGEEEHRPHAGSAWLDILIEARFARLPDAQADLARIAAIIGTVVPIWLLERVTGHDGDHPLVRDLIEQDFILPGERDGTLRFKHGITRDVIYDSVGLRMRRTFHHRIAEALRQRGADSGEEEFYEAMAYHFREGGDAASAAHYAELSGDKAMAASALDRAQAQYRVALDALDQLDATDDRYQRWNGIARRLGLASVFDPSRDQFDIFQRALARAIAHGDGGAIAWAEYWLGYLNYGLGESAKAITHCERALAAARNAGDDRLTVQIRATLGQARAATCDYDTALPLLDDAIAVKRSHRSGGRPSVGTAYSLACRGFVLADRGQFGEAQTCYDEALAMVRGAQHEVEGSIYTQLSAVSLWQGRASDAARYAAEGERVAKHARSRYLYAMARALGAYARWRADGTEEALQAIVEATAWLETGERQQFISLNHGWLAEALVQRGRIAEARHHAARALLRARKGDRLGAAMACRAMASAAALGHGHKPAAHYLRMARRSAAARQAPHEIAAIERWTAEHAIAAAPSARPTATL
nr:AAA family ATPase [Sphingomonas laterariae]